MSDDYSYQPEPDTDLYEGSSGGSGSSAAGDAYADPSVSSESEGGSGGDGHDGGASDLPSVDPDHPYALGADPDDTAAPSAPYALDGVPAPAGPHDPVVGDPEAAALHWHQQEAPFSCAVVSQEYVLDRVTGTDHAESDLSSLAERQGWYHPEAGTPMDEMSRILEHHGVPVSTKEGANMDDLRFALADGDHVIVAVDSEELKQRSGGGPEDLEALGYIPGQGADHAVVVTGLDYSDPDAPAVIVNDSGHEDGAGFRVPMTTFYRAWADSGHHMVRAEGTPVAPRTDGGTGGSGE
ncbi:hypothetical protein [Streptomyces hydrogenans]